MKPQLCLCLAWLLVPIYCGRLAAADPVETPPAAVHLLNSTNDYHLGDMIQLSLPTSEEFGKKILAKLTNDAATTIPGLQLHLNGVPMPDISVRDIERTNGAIILHFLLARDSQEDGSRRSWDQLLDQIGYSDNNLRVALSSGSGLSHVAPETLKFSVAKLAKGFGVGIPISFVFIILMWWMIARGMLREAGEGTAYSLGKSQMAFWGLLVALSFLGIFLITGEMERVPAQTLILMGISGATGLSAVLIGSSKSGGATNDMVTGQKQLVDLQAARSNLEGEVQGLQAKMPTAVPPGAGLTPEEVKKLEEKLKDLQSLKVAIENWEAQIKTLATSAAPAQSFGGRNAWLKDIISDANGLSFSRFQVFLWTLILGLVFVSRVCTRITMPEFEQTLLILMGISNGLYLGFKFPEKAG